MKSTSSLQAGLHGTAACHSSLLTRLSALQCVSKCAEKYIKHASRVGVRFGELSSEMEQQLKEQMEQAKK